MEQRGRWPWKHWSLQRRRGWVRLWLKRRRGRRMGRRGEPGERGGRRRRKEANRSELGYGVKRGDVAGGNKELCRAPGPGNLSSYFPCKIQNVILTTTQRILEEWFSTSLRSG